MARTVQLACAHCGHLQTYVVESTENGGEVVEAVRASGGDTRVDETATSAAIRLRRLALLPTSLPVGGIITPV